MSRVVSFNFLILSQNHWRTAFVKIRWQRDRRRNFELAWCAMELRRIIYSWRWCYKRISYNSYKCIVKVAVSVALGLLNLYISFQRSIITVNYIFHVRIMLVHTFLKQFCCILSFYWTLICYATSLPKKQRSYLHINPP